MPNLDTHIVAFCSRRLRACVRYWPFDLEVAGDIDEAGLQGDPADELIAAKCVHEVPRAVGFGGDAGHAALDAMKSR